MNARSIRTPALSLLFALLMLAVTLVAPADCWAAKKIVLQFEPGWAPPGINSAAVQSQIAARVRSHFGFNNSVDVATDGSTDFDKKVIVKPERPAPPDEWVVGHHFVCNSTNYVYGGTFKTAFNNSPALLNSAGVARVIARTAAHEAGHHGGLDDQNGDPTDTMGRPGLAPRVNTDSGFTPAAQSQLNSWVVGTSNKADAGLGGDIVDDGDALVCIFGEYTTTGEIIDDANHFNVEVNITGDITQFELGWMNIYDGFVPKIPENVPADQVSMFCGYEIDLAFRHVPSGEIFRATDHAAPALYMNPVPAALSSCPVVESDYFSTVRVDFPVIGMSVLLDALPHNPTCGFLAKKDAFPDKVPTVREWGVVILAILLIGYVAWRITRRLRRRAEA